MQYRWFPLVASLLTSACIFAGIWRLEQINQKQYRASVFDQVSDFDAKLKNALNRRLDILWELVGYVSANPNLSPSQFENFAKRFLKQQAGIYCIQLAQNSVVSHVYPTTASQQVLKHNLLDEPIRREAILKAIETRKTVVGGPYNLPQGKFGLIARLPIFIKSTDQNSAKERYWGLAIIVIDFPSLMAEVNLPDQVPKFNHSITSRSKLDGIASNSLPNTEVSYLYPQPTEVILDQTTGQAVFISPQIWSSNHEINWQLRINGIFIAVLCSGLAWLLAANPQKLRRLITQATKNIPLSKQQLKTQQKSIVKLAKRRTVDKSKRRQIERYSDSYQSYQKTIKASMLEQINLKSYLYAAITQEEFLVYYQPQVDLTSGQILGMEALVRWQHKTLGLLCPSQFITAAESYGMIAAIGEYVLKTACKQTKAWQELGYPFISISVNFSALQFQQSDLAEIVKQILTEVDLAPRYLDIEITETTVIKDIDQVITVLKKLKQMGTKISIDDFGTGYSSLSYLKSFPIDSIKIDGAFIRDITTAPEDAAITTAVIALAHSLGLKTVAEAVETLEQVQLLRSLQCDAIQGYFFSEPLSSAEAGQLLAENKRLSWEA